MHLKNVSLLKDTKKKYRLCPAYDMVAAQLVNSGDNEELALTLNGKKKKLKRLDFEKAMSRFEIKPTAFDNIFRRFQKAIIKWHNLINICFLSPEMKEAYHKMIDYKVAQIQLYK